MGTKKSSHNWEILALARFVLAMIVLFEHLPAIFHYKNTDIPWYSQIGAFEAVLGFLLISGLSIGNSIQKKQSGFFKRRVQRIYPVYVVSILLYYFVHFDAISVNFIVVILLNLLFMNQVFTYSYVVVAWSLSLEVWLYALAPFLYRRSFNTLMVLIYMSFGAFLFQTIGRTIFHWPYYIGISYGLNLLLLSFIWIAGFVYAIYPQKRKQLAMNVAGFFCIYILLIIGIRLLYDIKHDHPGDFFSYDLFPFGLKFLCLVFVYIVVFYNNYITWMPKLVKQLFNLLGNISYPLYLTHRTVFIFLNHHQIVNPLVDIFTAILIAFLVYILFDFYSKKRVVKYS